MSYKTIGLACVTLITTVASFIFNFAYNKSQMEDYKKIKEGDDTDNIIIIKN